jgi:DinB family protein
MGFDPADVTATEGLAPLRPVEVARLLRAARSSIVTELEALGDPFAGWRPDPGEWSANECVGHIIEADRRGFAGRIRRILAEDGVGEAGWNQIEVAAARRDWERPAAEVIAEFVAGRDDGIALVEGLRDADLERTAVHAVVGRVTVSNLLGEWVFHDRNHLRQLLANTQSRAWIGMGYTRRFSHPRATGAGDLRGGPRSAGR